MPNSTANAITVAELIEHLRKQPQGALIAYRLHSEQCLLELHQIRPASLCEPRPDGWVQGARPDMPLREYLLFPGN